MIIMHKETKKTMNKKKRDTYLTTLFLLAFEGQAKPGTWVKIADARTI
jgi:hypothetical protein